jgi:hypothetical protein
MVSFVCRHLLALQHTGEFPLWATTATIRIEWQFWRQLSVRRHRCGYCLCCCCRTIAMVLLRLVAAVVLRLLLQL